MLDLETRLRLRIDVLTDQRDHWRARYERCAMARDHWNQLYHRALESRESWKKSAGERHARARRGDNRT